MTQPVFVAGAHTEIGKTHVACALLRAARARGLSVDAFKPVVSGFDPAAWTDSDPGRLLSALGRAPSASALDAVSPWRFIAPLAPPMAARLEARPLPLAPIARACAEFATTSAEFAVIEGVGGVMSPIAEAATCLDLITALPGCAIMLVAGSYLGALSHTLTALEVLRARDRAPAVLVMSEDGDPGAPDFVNAVALLAEHAGGLSIIPARRGGGEAWTSQALDVLMQDSRKRGG
jgi:dethiobiotin synthetase